MTKTTEYINELESLKQTPENALNSNISPDKKLDKLELVKACVKYVVRDDHYDTNLTDYCIDLLAYLEFEEEFIYESLDTNYITANPSSIFIH